jgi:hypothetical protein
MSVGKSISFSSLQHNHSNVKQHISYQIMKMGRSRIDLS